MNQLVEWHCPSPESVRALGRALGEVRPLGACVALLGDLGAGKTTFTQGLGSGLGIQEDITSPTFALMVEYEARCSLLHVDAYRLAPGESESIGLEEALEAWEGISVVEWAALVPDALPAECLFVQITIVPDGRQVQAWASTSTMMALLNQWRART